MEPNQWPISGKRNGRIMLIRVDLLSSSSGLKAWRPKRWRRTMSKVDHNETRYFLRATVAQVSDFVMAIKRATQLPASQHPWPACSPQPSVLPDRVGSRNVWVRLILDAWFHLLAAIKVRLSTYQSGLMASRIGVKRATQHLWAAIKCGPTESHGEKTPADSFDNLGAWLGALEG